MKPSIKKAVTGKTMRVATTFTGAAACAVAFTPAAVAGTGHTAAAAQPAQHHQVKPDIIQANCLGANQSHWLHMVNTRGSVTCFGFRGATFINPNPSFINSFCGGNNSGFIYGTNNRGVFKSIFYGHGTFYAKIPSRPFAVSFVSLINFGGNDKCPL